MGGGETNAFMTLHSMEKYLERIKAWFSLHASTSTSINTKGQRKGCSEVCNVSIDISTSISVRLRDLQNPPAGM